MPQCYPPAVQPLNTLPTQEEEELVARVLQRLKGEVRKIRLNLYPYFRDYDRVGGQLTSVVWCPTFNHSYKHNSISNTSALWYI